MIPAFNEQDAIASTIRNLRDAIPDIDILVINDGSTDETSLVARATQNAIVIDLPCNLGIGGAVQTGFMYAAQHGYDIAIQFDADGQHIAEEIGTLLEPIDLGHADVVIGSRFLETRSFRSSVIRRMGIFIFYVVNSVLIKQAITDNTSGFRAYNRRAISFLAKHYPMDYPEPEAVILLGRNGFRLKEVAVRMQERQGGVSSITAYRSIYYMVKVLLAILITYFREPVVRR